MTAPAPAPPTPALRIIQRCEGNPYYRAAVETPEWREALAYRERLLHKRVELQRPTPPVKLDPSNDLDAWLDDSARVAADERARADKLAALDSEILQCDYGIQAVQSDPNPALAKLGHALEELMTATVAPLVKRLKGARTAAGVIASGDPDVLAARKELEPARDELDKVWQAQDWLTAGDTRFFHTQSEYLNDRLASDLTIRNIDFVFPDWKRPAPNHALQRWDTPDARPWPKDPVEQLIWLATSGAQVWTPTTHQLRELHDQRIRDRAHPNGEPHPQPATEVLNSSPRASDDYYSRVVTPLETAARPAELDLEGEPAR
jgi:hypothetical protein